MFQLKRSYFWFCVLAAPLLSPMVSPLAARADEFATVPAGDLLYRQLEIVQRAGWGTAGREATRPVASLTRYEMALETARAYYAATAQQRVNANWQKTASRPAVRALRELMLALRVELGTLDINLGEALSFCDKVLQSKAEVASLAPATTPARQTPLSSQATRLALRPTSMPVAGRVVPRDSMMLPLSQRLRLHATLSSLAREANDPFGDSARPVADALKLLRPGRSTPRHALQAQGGAALDVNNWLRLRADYDSRSLLPNRTDPSHLLNEPATGASSLLLRSLNQGATQGSSLGGGIDIELLSGLTLSGEVARVSANGAGDAMRYGGGVGLTAWQNRLSLSANLSRLVPQEDSAVLSTTAAALNLDVGMTERLKLRLLYQQLFGSPTQSRNDRVVAGGLNISF